MGHRHQAPCVHPSAFLSRRSSKDHSSSLAQASRGHRGSDPDEPTAERQRSRIGPPNVDPGY